MKGSKDWSQFWIFFRVHKMSCHANTLEWTLSSSSSYFARSGDGDSLIMITFLWNEQWFSAWEPRGSANNLLGSLIHCFKQYYFERLGSTEWCKIFERFRDLKKVEKHCYRPLSRYHNNRLYHSQRLKSSQVKSRCLWNGQLFWK